jgi:hypothetical protein
MVHIGPHHAGRIPPEPGNPKETTMKGGELEDVTIAGEVFKIDTPYAEGHTCTAGEASALNQTRQENLRNNFAKKVKDAKEAGTFDLAAFQTQLDEYAAQYEFGVRQGGGGVRGPADPVKREALNIAVAWLVERLKAKGKTIGPKGDHTMAQVRESAPAVLEKHPEWVEEAQAIVARRKEMLADVGGEEIDLDSLMPDNDENAPATADGAPASAEAA